MISGITTEGEEDHGSGEHHHSCCVIRAREIARQELEAGWANTDGATSVPIKITIDGEDHDGVMIIREKETNETVQHIEVNNEGEPSPYVAA